MSRSTTQEYARRVAAAVEWTEALEGEIAPDWLLTKGEVVVHIARNQGVAEATATSYIKEAVAAGKLVEIGLSQYWEIHDTTVFNGVYLPPLYVQPLKAKYMDGPPGRNVSKDMPRGYGPGRMKMIATPGHIALLAKTFKDREDAERKVKQQAADAERAERHAEWRLECIDRDPELVTLVEEFELLFGDEADVAMIPVTSMKDKVVTRVGVEGGPAGRRKLRIVLEAGLKALKEQDG